MKFWVEEPDARVTGVKSTPQAVCRLGHEQCSDFTGGPCSERECTCETDGNCPSCTY